MINTIIASVALLAATASAQVGSAIVVNACPYPVTLTNVPSSGGGQNQVGPNTLQQGGTYSQQYTSLTNGNGWSIKLSLTPALTSLLQFEYTYQNDETAWWDLSAVNGDPFAGDWVLSATGGCAVRQSAYLFPTDDAQGEQSCPSTDSVTVTLCGTSQGGSPIPPIGGSPAPSAPSSPAPSSPMQPPAAPAPSDPAPSDPAPSDPAPSDPAPSDPAPTTPPAVPAPSPAPSSPSPEPSAPAHRGHHFGKGEGNAAQFTTFATQGKAVDIVTNVHTTVVTHYVTVSPSPVHKRQVEHLHRHAHYHDRF